MGTGWKKSWTALNKVMSAVSKVPMKGVLPEVSKRLPPKESKFARDTIFAKRLGEAEDKLKEFPDRVPVILEAAKSATVELDKRKYLVPASVTVAQFLQIVRKRVKLSPEQAIFLFVDNTLPPMSQLMSQLYQTHAANDRFLYIVYSTESTFG